MNYNKVIELVKSDDRIGSPDHDGKHGYGGTCFSKDTNSMYYQMVGHVKRELKKYTMNC